MTAVTSSCSRAIVHSDWIVYIAEPSACSASTGRSGQATAAPTATGRPCRSRRRSACSQSWRRRPGGRARRQDAAGVAPRRRRSRPRAATRATAAASAVGGQRAGRALGPRRRRRRCRPSAPTSSASASSAPSASSRAGAELVHLAALGHQVARLAGVGEERDRAPSRRRGPGAAGRRAGAPPARRSTPIRSTAGRPAPRSVRAGKVSASSRAPVPAATRAADRSAASRSARAAEQQRDRLARAEHLRHLLEHLGRRPARPPGRRARRRGSAPSLHDTSAGRISVATWPGGPVAAAIASAASRRQVGGGSADRPSATRCARPSRCRTAAARRTGCGRSRGRRRC